MKHPATTCLTGRLLSAISMFTSAWGLALALSSTSCTTTGEPNSASFASVTIQNRSPEEIIQATAQVFGADGWRGGMSGPGQMIFEKEASRGTTLAREGVVGTFYGAQTMNRVRAEIISLAGEGYRLQCKAYLITGGSDPFFQEEKPLTNIRSAPYQSLLNKVAEKLK